MAVLILNGGSSSWKVSIYGDVAAGAVPVEAAIATAELSWPSADDARDARLTLHSPSSAKAAGDPQTLRVAPNGDAIGAACDALRATGAPLDGLRAIGHRVVHGGMLFAHSVRIDAKVEAGLRSLEPLAPSHNKRELAGMDATRALFPGVPQIAAFDTSFHRTLAPAAYVYPGPYAWRERDIRRYGFHGLSVAYCTERAAQLLGRDQRDAHLIVAHLGGGCSVTAVRDGASVDTSMGFTPLDGTMMGTRSGAVDPGILTYLARELAARGESAAAVAGALDDALNHKSGLLGISGISDDVRDIEAAASGGNDRAQLALDLFAHRTAVTIAGMATSLDRVDALVFTGGIGEHAAPVRARICARLRMFGIALDETANFTLRDEGRIATSGPPVLVVPTREEWYVARECARVLA